MELNYHHLKLFRAIAREGGLTRAAEHLHLSQSALSVQLQRLEEQLGHALFVRQGKRLVLTEAGRIALDYADVVFRAGDELVSTLQGRPRGAGQVLRIGALTTLSRNFQIEFLRPLTGRRDVTLVLRSGTMRELLAQLEAHRLDIVLANAPVRREPGSDIHCHLLDEQPVSLVGRPPVGGPFRFPQDLAGARLLLPSHDSEIRAAFDHLLALNEIHVEVAAEVDDMAMLRLLARDGDALAVVPPIVVRDELRTGRLVERCRIPGVAERFHAVVQSRRFPNPLLAELLRPRGEEPSDPSRLYHE